MRIGKHFHFWCINYLYYKKIYRASPNMVFSCVFHCSWVLLLVLPYRWHMNASSNQLVWRFMQEHMNEPASLGFKLPVLVAVHFNIYRLKLLDHSHMYKLYFLLFGIGNTVVTTCPDYMALINQQFVRRQNLMK